MSSILLSDRAAATVDRARGAELLRFLIGGTFHVECYGPDGDLRWKDTARNGVTSVGLDYILNTCFVAGTPATTWYIGIVDNSGWTGWNLADTMASHSAPNAWAEVAGANYQNTTRPAWTPGNSSGNSITNASTVNYSMIPSATLTVKGLFLVSDNTKAGTAGTLFSTASFTGGTQQVNNGDTLKVTYTMNAANSAGNT